MTPETLRSVRTDLAYAIHQLRRFRDVDRALNALERIEEILERELASEDQDAVEI